MKMRKIISLCAALSIAVTAFATTASAALVTAKGDLSIAVDVPTSPMSNEDFLNIWGVDIPVGYESYAITVDIKGFKDDLKYTKGAGAAGKYNGISIDVVGLNFVVDNISNVSTDYSAVVDSSTNLDIWEKSEILSPFSFDEGSQKDIWKIEYSATRPYPSATNTSGVTDGKTNGMFTAYITVKTGTEVTFTSVTEQLSNKVMSSTIQVCEWTNSVQSSTDFTGLAGSFKVGKAVQADTLKMENLTNTVANENGYIWKMELTKGANAITEFTALFTEKDTNETADRVIRNLNTLNGVDGIGSAKADFYIGLKTAKKLSSAVFSATDGTTPVSATWNAPVAE